MSLPRDRRVVSPSVTAVPAQVGVTLVSTSSTPPQVTLEPLTSFKRSLEELGFTAPDEQGHRADSPIPVDSSTVTTNSAPSIVADRGTTESSGMMAATAAPIPTQPSARSMPAARVMLTRRRSSLATPPLLPPIHSQSHLLELIPGFTNQEPLRERMASPASETTGNSSTSETEVVLTTPSSRARLHELRQRLANAANAASATPTRRLFRHTPLQRSAAFSNATATAPSQQGSSLEDTASSHRSPTLPPIDTSDNGLGGLTGLLYTDSTSTEMRPAQSSSFSLQNRNLPLNTPLSNLTSRSRTFLPGRPFVESPSPPIHSTPATTATIAATLSNWDRIREFEEAIAPLRNTPPPPASTRPRPPNLSLRPAALYPPFLPHPFEEIMSPSTTAGESDEASEYNWEETRRSYRDELRYIHNLNTVIDERERESGELTPVLTVPMLPPILPSPLLVTDGGLGFGNDASNPAGRTGREEETEWEADEVPSAWLREARRHFINSGPSSGSARDGAAPLLELPNISSTSLGLLDFPPSSSPTTANPLSSRISTEQLRQLPTEHLRQLRRFALRNVASRSRSRSSLAPSVVESISDGENRGDIIRPESVVSNEDIVVRVPPMLDEPFEGSVWRALESSLQQEHGHHYHHQPHRHHQPPPPIDTRRHPRISLPPMSSGLDFDGNLLSRQAEVINDASSNVSVRSAVPSSSPETAIPARHSIEPELGEWREHINELVEGSLSSQSLPALALTPPPLSTSSQTQRNPINSSGSHPHLRPTRSRASHARSASTGSGETFLDTAALRHQFDLRRDANGGRLASAGRDNSLAVAMAEMESDTFRAPGIGRSSIIVDLDQEGYRSSPLRDLLGLSERSPRLNRGQSQENRLTPNTEAYRLLDGWWSESTNSAVQMMNRELEFMDRYLMERSNDSPRTHRRSLTPLWDTDDPLSDFLSDVGFDGSYEALLALSEQLGVVPRGVSDSSFAALKTTLFKDLEPELVAMSPTLSTISSINGTEINDTSPKSTTVLSFSTPASPTRTSFTSTRMARKESGKLVPQCSICLEEYLKEDVCVTLDCTHFFHQPCVREWLRSASTCPLCRHPLPRT